MHPDEAGRSEARVDDLEARLTERGRPFATVTVVRREPPVSANVGDRAIVTPDGELHGWIGGVACAQSIAIREGMKAIERREPTLIGIAPDPDTVDRPGLESYPMTCHSEGVLELFIEPVGTRTRLVLFGDSPIVHTLATIAPEVGIDATVVTNDETISIGDDDTITSALDGASFAVIASMGAYDDEMLSAAITAECPYIGFIASDDRATIVTERLAERLEQDATAIADRIDQPAGLDIGAETPGEIAVAILAKLIQVRLTIDHPVGGIDESTREEAPTTSYIDPVCGMEVELDTAAATNEYNGTTFAFCGQGCADAFTDDPERFLAEVE